METDRTNIEDGRRVAVRPDGRVEIEPFTPRTPDHHEVLIATACTLISAGTELGMQEQERNRDIYPGYSNVGTIVAVGKDVKDCHVGDVVMSLGNHASHVTVSAAPQSIARVASGVSVEEATFGVLASVAAHGARRARIEWGEHVAITGMGLVGQLTLQLVARTGCESLIAIDLSDFRLHIARKHGATHTFNPKRTSLTDEIRQITGGRGLDCVIEASGYPELLPIAFDLSRIGGRVIVLGSIWHRKIEVDFMSFHEKELTLIGVHQPKCPIVQTPYFPWTQSYNRRQMLKMIADGRLHVASLITHRLPFTEAAEAYRLLRTEKDRALGVILNFIC